MLEIRHYKKYYNGILVLDIPHLVFPAGIHWIKGKNGSGKTTLFKTLAGLVPFEGTIQLDSQTDLRKQAVPYRMKVNYGEAEPVYPGFLSAKDLIHFVSAAKKAPTGQADSLIEVFQMDHYIHTPCATYSSGMLKKLSLVLAFLGKPSLIILDEPLTTIDDATATQVYHLIQRYWLESNTSFLLSSHHQFDFSALSVSTTFLVENQTVIPLPVK
ncbi:ABC transporter ATP-binding protein [Rhodocytophaga rosea]|uniref:ABC transporter ATP-binding protein n=1 Tax=Rhodocytophaga rosea TaxID=2704465 RepID=A0A6C0GJN1_9BACT|nr:ABC transporter ATP-binding protein [Rhodocytophaga rosea]QHT68248.1 ABC transporter ATP-binding protein [Rhodocytophaga rosea]